MDENDSLGFRWGKFNAEAKGWGVPALSLIMLVVPAIWLVSIWL